MEIEKQLTKQDLINFIDQLRAVLTSEDPKPIQLNGFNVALPRDISCELEFEQEDNKAELELELKWYIGSQHGIPESITKNSKVIKGLFEIFQGKDLQFYFHLKAANHQIILASEGYRAIQGARQGVESVKRNAFPERFEIRRSQAQQFYFVLLAANGEIIGKSQMYKRKVGCQKGIQSVIRHGQAEVVEI